MKIGIIGNGYVGGASALLGNEKVSVLVYDTAPDKCSPKGLIITDLVDCDFVFVCVPTPMYKDGSCATHIVESVVDDLAKAGYDRERVVVKSTVPVGTCRKLGVMFMPEFLTEQNWKKDFLNQKKWILGTND